MRKIKDYFDYPTYLNYSSFCEKYMYYFNTLQSFVDESEFEYLKLLKSKIYLEKVMGTLKSDFANMTDSEINNYFHKENINLIEQIPHQLKENIYSEIDKLLMKNLSYVKKLNLYSPMDKNLTTYEYYYNQIIIEKVLPAIKIKIEAGSPKK